MSSVDKDCRIEQNIKFVASISIAMIVTLLVALFVVNSVLGTSITSLSSRVVPIQRELGDLSSSIGSIYLRQNEILRADTNKLGQLESRDASEERALDSQSQLLEFLSARELREVSDFPFAAESKLQDGLAEFLEADTKLLEAKHVECRLEDQFAATNLEIEQDLKTLLQASAGIAGVLRLNYVVRLRELATDLRNDQRPDKKLHQVIYGDSRTKMESIDRLNRSVLRLNVLAWKIAVEGTNDELNSLHANELLQNKALILESLDRIERLLAGEQMRDRVTRLKGLATDLVRRVGDEGSNDSLLSQRRQILKQRIAVEKIYSVADRTAMELELCMAMLREFSQRFASDSSLTADTTIRNSRLAVGLVAGLGFLLVVLAGTRVKRSLVALRDQNRQLQEISFELVKANEGLEQSVRDRTASLQLVLDSTGDGMLVVGLDGKLQPERSRAVIEWFGEVAEGATLWDYLGKVVPDERAALQLGFEQIADDFLPFEVTSAQAPSRLKLGKRTLSIQYRAVLERSKLAQVVVLLSDITSKVEAERAELAVRELHQLIGNIMKDRDGFSDMIEECSRLIEATQKETDFNIANRNLHTIKGNCAIMGFHGVADAAHKIESAVQSDNRMASANELTQLEGAWRQSLHRIGDYLDSGNDRSYRVTEEELDALDAMIRNELSIDEMQKFVTQWRLEPTVAPLRRLASQAERLAKQLGKQIKVTINDSGLRLPPQSLRAFWSAMVHVVRNAVGHGIESPEERVNLGKPACGQLTLFTTVRNDWFEVGIRDDGRGVNWQAVREGAEAKGIAIKSDEDLMEALFSDGLSTMDRVTEISGRGVGLSAVRSACEAVGGSVSVETSALEETTFIFRFPMPVVAYDACRATALNGETTKVRPEQAD